jgi:hypothetical protein
MPQSLDLHQSVQSPPARDVADNRSVALDSPRELRLMARAHVSCEAVYATLVDASSHLEWAGRGQPPYFRLLSLEAPDGQLTVGDSFSSTGSIPGTRRRFHDLSRVVLADPSSVFEFVTEATVPGRKPMQATFRHRYELEPNGDGCRVRYSFRQENLVNPMLRLSLPIVRDFSWKFGMPMMMRGGLRNLVRAAERRAAAPLTLSGSR